MENIDGPLCGLNPSLIAGYEKYNGVDLTKVNKEYKRASQKDPLIMWLTWFKIASVIAVIALVVSLVINIGFDQSLLSVIFMALVAISLVLYSKFVVTKKVSRVEEARSKFEPTLEEFWEAVCGLDSNIWGRIRNESDVRAELVQLAINILEAEEKFDQVRLQKERIVSDILRIGHWLEESQNKLDRTLGCIQKFGLEFRKTDLFADAKKHLDRRP
jgi:hypothetical protein